MGRWIPLTGLVLFCALLFFPGLAHRDLTSSHEARAAQNAQMMLDEGDWLLPRLYNRQLELQKPPLYYWLVAAIAWMKGGVVDAWAVRLPATLSACATVLFLYYLGVRRKRPLAGILAAIFLTSCVHFTWLARVGRIDMPMTLAITLALGAFHLGRADDASRGARFLWRVLGYAALGAGALLKGPIALVLPAVVAAAAWLVYDRRLRLATSLWWGVPLTLAIAAPWFFWANWRTDNRLWEVFFWYHNVERGLGSADALASYPWWYYGPRVFVDLLPWVFLLPFGVHALIRVREVRQDEASSLGLIWFASILVFLSCMKFKRADYLLPAYPGLAIFLGAWAERQWRAIQPRLSPGTTRACAGALLAFAAVVIGGWWTHAGVFSGAHEHAHSRLATEIRRQTAGPVVFFRAEAHLLTFRVGRPAPTILEWENLNAWARQPRPVYIVMPAASARAWRDHLSEELLEETLHSEDFGPETGDRPLVVLRNRPAAMAARVATDAQGVSPGNGGSLRYSHDRAEPTSACRVVADQSDTARPGPVDGSR